MSTPDAAPVTAPALTAAPSPPAESAQQRRLNAFVKVSSPIMSTLALIYLVIYSAQAIFYHPTERWYVIASWFGLALWVVFAIDLAYRFILTPVKRGFFKKNWLDTITVVVPQFRALRVLRAFTGKSIINRKGKSALSGGAVTTAVLGTLIIVWVGSLMVLSAERSAANATITSFPDALWWSFETITTVGYGDFTPVTWLGRSMAVLIMFVGISVLGIVSAGLAATLVKQAPPPPTPAQEVLTELAQLKEMVARIEAQLAGTAAPVTSPPTVQA